jgi:hypothetical protein
LFARAVKDKPNNAKIKMKRFEMEFEVKFVELKRQV